MNFWTDLMPRTDLVYHKMFESIPDKLRVELANKKDDVLRSRFKEMQEIRRMSGEDFAREAYEFIGTLERMEAVFALFILLSCEKYTPYRHVEVDIIVSPKRAQEDWLQRRVITRGIFFTPVNHHAEHGVCV
ncbi:MAG: hypothetical protein HGA33_03785 [Candidatus Moranbacteria bacterium]|nr:hypothetical protein [Candidatus Moranbacteria bacterium]